ncbi:MAG: MFS transporter [Jatrophihabitans endophyticus]|nr:MFS transporter [Jatrophihabitans endophyticus]
MLGATLPTPLYPAYAAEFGYGELVSTVVFATYAIGVVTGLLGFGHWSDEVGRRPMLGLGLALSALSAVAFVLPSALGWLFVGRFLSGLSAGVFTGTATATLIDLAPDGGKARASLVAAAVNMAGLGSGPLLAGVLTRYAPLPLRLAYLVDLGLVAVAAVAVVSIVEPVDRRETPQLRPRGLQLPAEVRPIFARAAVAGFAGFAVIGLFTSVSPAFLADVLDDHNAALVGVVVIVLFAASVAGQVASSSMSERRALPLGCAGLIVGMALVAVSLGAASLPVLLAGAVIAGAGQGMSFRSGLGAVSGAAPEHLRGAVTSTYFVSLYVGIAIPVIGEGALASATGLVTAGVSFAILVGVLAATALVLLVRSGGRRPA